MATRRLKKGETPLSRVAQIERSIKTWRTKLVRASNALKVLEKDRAHFVKKAVELGLQK